ncbi:hypothetical protein B0H19DRAFT_1258767 [Mycena capillaripes]|nr:hypothetical protein B0H19DRAFT_1258767 [Mycena capillaripes]
MSSPRPQRTNIKAYEMAIRGHMVGTFDSWRALAAAKTSLTGYPGSTNKGYNSVAECIDTWQTLCPTGVHPHPVDPTLQQESSTSTTKALHTSPGKRAPKCQDTPAEGDAQSLFGLHRIRSRRPAVTPPPSPSHAAPREAADSGDNLRFVSFAICGGGIVSSSLTRSQTRYLASQRRGEEPEMLVTGDVLETLSEDRLEGNVADYEDE